MVSCPLSPSAGGTVARGTRAAGPSGVFWVSKRVQHVGLVILVQAGCLAVGLWVQYRYSLSSAESAAVVEAQSDMDAFAVRLATELSDVDLRSAVPGTSEYERVAQWLNGPASAERNAFLVDPDWRVVATGSPTLKTDPARSPTIGAPLSWTPSSDSPRNSTQPMHGTLELPDGVHVAVAHALQKRNGYVVVHEPRAASDAHVAAILESLPAISGLTLLWTCALLSLATYMIVARFHDDAERERGRSLAEALLQKQNLIRTRDAVIFGLAKLADSRDSETGDHLERISVYSTTLASLLRQHPRYADTVTPGFVRLIGISSALHDIGKVGIEDSILLKPAKLTPAERVRIQEHAAIGGECLREIEQRLGSSNFLQMAREIAFAHHERWDGTGYPHGLKAEEIPLAARIVAIVDVYDALSSRRVYKGPHSHEECVAIIRNAAGKQFDPELVKVWLTIEGKFAEIARRYGNDTAERLRTDSKPPTVAGETEYGLEKECLVSSAAGVDE